VVPEAEAIQRPLLVGEPPDPTRIPTGCRFHPRCPALADGRAGVAGVAEACTTLDPVLEALSDGHLTACHLAVRAVRGFA
jgi:peptide/nickel transport system ATP-binding protein